MQQKKKTLVVGASEKPHRYSNKAIRKLLRYGHEVVPLAPRDGQVAGVPFVTGFPKIEDVHTVTLYIGPARQPAYYDYLIALKPKRIIFNPGTENPVLLQKAQENGIETIENCTLVMLETLLF
ncbi:CoA-binding protein [Candidatus Sulfidibacterium hydrothermale]|uniref:CoA-binding protein n=1 Tax=Candidatus Sulfidibacterium hydrothermale TaxID=2875962 RepID=UPI001F0B6CC0|nr:CoA-binding protein [Candidatus Sulfidibacterium hydrothermale]UBM62250.1 CoA-binding protein [Candidatus Sulfidibacterium hydrothermale]